MSAWNHSGTVYTVTGTLLVLAVGSAIRLAVIRRSKPEIAALRLASLKTWWVLAVLLSVAALTGLPGATVLMGLASVLGLREYLKLLQTDRPGPTTVAAAYAIVVLHYVLIAAGAQAVARTLLPAAVVIVFGSLSAARGHVRGYVRSTAGLAWGVLLLGYAPSHSLFMFDLPLNHVPWSGVAGWFLFLVLLTEVSDIFQAITGRRFGRHKATPTVSPHKSWEGLLGGLVVTTALAILLAPWLTTFCHGRSPVDGWLVSALAGMLIVISGFCGDINLSAVKRDAGVKDAGTLLPGQGGILDRIDSLSFSAPVFYYYVLLVHL